MAAAPRAPLTPEDRRGRGQTNLTDLADALGLDKGSPKHRYTELYQMLFLPFRQRAIKLLEIGPPVGAPDDLTSARLWLDYFPKAEVHGLDPADTDWFSDPRYVHHRLDPEDRAALRAGAGDMPPLDIVIDDGSHASHHQQNGFLELFGTVKSGGLYIVEDLRWQPDEIERPGITKTADLFQSYIQDGVFTHSDPGVAAEFDALRADISGCFVFQARFEKRRKDQVLVVHKR
ncbi:hypothetical protein KTJ87_03825 [Rhodobacteraceae bacterium ASV31]|nr:hypothetical protein [Anianabacter salinae]